MTAPVQSPAGRRRIAWTSRGPRRRMVTKWMPPVVQPRQLRVGRHLRVEVQPLRVVPRQLVPELDEPQDLSRLLGASQVGVGVAEDAAVVLQGEEGLDARLPAVPRRGM